MDVSSLIGGVLESGTYDDLHLYMTSSVDSTSYENEGFIHSTSNGSTYFGIRGITQGSANHHIYGTSAQSTNASNAGFVTGYPYVYHAYNKTT
jgi:hypothetical protein